MWQAYFHPESKIVGIDINADCAQHSGENIEVCIGSQDDEQFLEELASQYKKFDIIIDDGSHINSHVIKSFGALYGYVAENGVYLIEDVHTSYWADYGGGLRAHGSTIEFAKEKIDELNATHIREISGTKEFTRITNSITFYDSVVVFEKSRQGNRQSIITQGME